jgi:alanine racemase
MDKWVEIDGEKLLHNVTAVMQHVPAEVRLLAVLKNNAYGLGAVSVGQLMTRLGITYFGVSYLEEALELRQGGITADILIFAPLTTAEEVRVAFQNNLTVTVASLYDRDLLLSVSEMLNFRLRVHVKLDTGLSRFGVSLEELVEVCHTLRINERINVEGIYTHMADAANRSYTEKQFALFQQGLALCAEAGIHFQLRHCAGSRVFLDYPHMHLDMVRLGTLLAGQYPAGRHEQKDMALADPFAFKSRVIAVNSRASASYLGYYRAYRLKRKADIAVIPVGYADGLALEVNNPPQGWWDLCKKMIKQILAFCNMRRFTLHIKVKNCWVPVRGKVFMQMALLELPAGLKVQPGDEVEVPVRMTLVKRDVVRVMVKAGEAARMDNAYVAKAII